MRSIRLSLPLSLFLALTFSVAAQTTRPSTPPAARPEPKPAPAEQAPSAEEAVEEATTEAAPGTYAIFLTTHGNFVAELETEKAPKTAGNFIALAKGEIEFTNRKTGEKVAEPYFDGSVFHRIIPGFVVQGGAHKDDARMQGPGYSIDLEIHPDLKHDRIGALSMARTNDPNSASSQFFVTLAPQPNLDDATIKALPPAQARGYGGAGYAVFGYVVEGFDTLKELEKLGSRSGTPTGEGRMERVVIVEGTPEDYKAKLAELTGE